MVAVSTGRHGQSETRDFFRCDGDGISATIDISVEIVPNPQWIKYTYEFPQ